MSNQSDYDDLLNEKFKILLDEDTEIKKWNEGILIKSLMTKIYKIEHRGDVLIQPAYTILFRNHINSLTGAGWGGQYTL